MDVAYFIQQSFLTAGSQWEGDQISIFHTYEDLVSSDTKPDVFVIGYKDSVLTQQLLVKLRANKSFYLVPVFLESRIGGAPKMLADGIAPSPEAARRKANEAVVLQDVESDDKDIRLLSYLFSRKHANLMPLADWHARGVYYYPLLRALSDYDTDELVWLDSLLARNLLKPVKLVDKVRFCCRCHSAHLNYIDICPVCDDVNINDPGASAEAGEIVEHVCHECQHHFEKPNIIARCMTCHNTNKLSQLVVRSVYSFTLSERGEELVLSLMQAKVFAKAVLKTMASHQYSKMQS